MVVLRSLISTLSLHKKRITTQFVFRRSQFESLIYDYPCFQLCCFYDRICTFLECFYHPFIIKKFDKPSNPFNCLLGMKLSLAINVFGDGQTMLSELNRLERNNLRII